MGMFYSIFLRNPLNRNGVSQWPKALCGSLKGRRLEAVTKPPEAGHRRATCAHVVRLAALALRGSDGLRA